MTMTKTGLNHCWPEKQPNQAGRSVSRTTNSHIVFPCTLIRYLCGVVNTTKIITLISPFPRSSILPYRPPFITSSTNQLHKGRRSDSSVKQELVMSSDSPLAASPVLSTTCVWSDRKKLHRNFTENKRRGVKKEGGHNNHHHHQLHMISLDQTMSPQIHDI